MSNQDSSQPVVVHEFSTLAGAVANEIVQGMAGMVSALRYAPDRSKDESEAGVRSSSTFSDPEKVKKLQAAMDEEKRLVDRTCQVMLVAAHTAVSIAKTVHQIRRVLILDAVSGYLSRTKPSPSAETVFELGSRILALEEDHRHELYRQIKHEM